MGIKLSNTEIGDIISRIRRNHKNAQEQEREKFNLPAAELAEIRKASRQLTKLPKWFLSKWGSYGVMDYSYDYVLKRSVEDRKSQLFVSKLPMLKDELDLKFEIMQLVKHNDFKSVDEIIARINPYKPNKKSK